MKAQDSRRYVRADAPDVVVAFRDRQTQWAAADGEVLIGREEPPSQIQIEHPAVSRLHARLVPGAVWRLVDFDSLNGVYLAGERISDVVITDGMTVHLGHPAGVEVTFRLVPAVEPPEDDTERISDEIRRAVLNDEIVVSLDALAAELTQLPVATARCGGNIDGLRQRLTRLDSMLSALSALGAKDTASAFRTVRNVYERMLDQAGSAVPV